MYGPSFMQLPNRVNYVLWMEDLVVSWLFGAHAKDGGVACPSEIRTFPRVAIDVGTGGSAIFPLLGTCYAFL